MRFLKWKMELGGDHVNEDDVTFPSGKLFLDQFLGLFLLNSQEFWVQNSRVSKVFGYNFFKVK